MEQSSPADSRWCILDDDDAGPPTKEQPYTGPPWPTRVRQPPGEASLPPGGEEPDGDIQSQPKSILSGPSSRSLEPDPCSPSPSSPSPGYSCQALTAEASHPAARRRQSGDRVAQVYWDRPPLVYSLKRVFLKKRIQIQTQIDLCERNNYLCMQAEGRGAGPCLTASASSRSLAI